jgi:pSer/pThr/pTyr-binding forkhead associated (FHA) protein
MAGDEPLTASLEVVKGAQPGARLALGAASTTLGRSPGNTHVIADTAISRQHAKIFLRDGRHWIADSNSSHGTFVNGAKITLQTLVDGDEIKLGGTLLRYVEVKPAAAPPPVMPKNAAPPPPPAPKLVPPDAGTGSFDLELPESEGASAASPATRGPLPPISTSYRRALTTEGEDPFADDETRSGEAAASEPKVEKPAPSLARAPSIELRGETARQFASRAGGPPASAGSSPSASAARPSAAHAPPALPAPSRARGPLSFLRDELDQRGAVARTIATLFALAVAGGLFWLALRLFDAAPKSGEVAPDEDGAPRTTGAPQAPKLPERR